MSPPTLRPGYKVGKKRIASGLCPTCNRPWDPAQVKLDNRRDAVAIKKSEARKVRQKKAALAQQRIEKARLKNEREDLQAEAEIQAAKAEIQAAEAEKERP